MPKSSYASRVPRPVLMAHVILGALQISVGCLVIALNLVVLSAAAELDADVAAGGLWAGPFFIAAGVAGVVAGKRVRGCSQGCVVTCLVLSILAAFLGFCALIVESCQTFTYARALRSSAQNRIPNPDDPSLRATQVAAGISEQPSGGLFMRYYITNVFCILLFAFEFVLAIVHSAFGCRASCCCVVPVLGDLGRAEPQVPEFYLVDDRSRVMEPAPAQPILGSCNGVNLPPA